MDKKKIIIEKCENGEKATSATFTTVAYTLQKEKMEYPLLTHWAIDGVGGQGKKMFYRW